MNNCSHENFAASVEVTRLIEYEGSQVTGYSADVRVVCVDCKMPFQFIGLPGGLDPNKPMVSFDQTEARMPIRPLVTIQGYGWDGIPDNSSS